MKKAFLLLALLVILPVRALAGDMDVWQLVTQDGQVLTEICTEPAEEDEYISADNVLYRVVSVTDGKAFVEACGPVEFPSTDWMDAEQVYPVMAVSKRIYLYCTHSDESYQPSDGYYSTEARGTIYQVAQSLADALGNKGVDATVADTLHHPHDAGAYRRSRQTAVQLLKSALPDCLIDIHRDGIPDPASYAVSIGGENVSKIRLLVGRGNQNAAANKDFALTIKAVADRVYPGLIKDIYMGKGTFNQDLLPHSILLECGTYTLDKTRVLASMPLMADVLNRALYGGVVGSAGRVASDVKAAPNTTAGITQGEPDTPAVVDDAGTGQGFGFLAVLLIVGVVGIALLSAGSWKGGMHKAERNISEMTGRLIGKKPDDGEDPEHS